MKFLNVITLILVLFPSIIVSSPNAKLEKTSEQDIRTIEVEGTDQMKFDVTKINATAGEKIKIVVTTKSNMPKVAMAHNMVILKSSVDTDAFITASARERSNGYIAPEFKDQIIASTALAGGGETVEVTFTVPEKPGKYEYVCTFPGHYAAGMKGSLIVKDAVSS